MENIDKKEKTNALELLVDSLINFAEAYLKLLKLEIRNGIAVAITILLISLIIITLATFTLLFLSIGVAFWLAESKHIGLTGGFSIVGGFYFLLLLLTLAIRKKVKATLDNLIENIIKKTE